MPDEVIDADRPVGHLDERREFVEVLRVVGVVRVLDQADRLAIDQGEVILARLGAVDGRAEVTLDGFCRELVVPQPGYMRLCQAGGEQTEVGAADLRNEMVTMIEAQSGPGEWLTLGDRCSYTRIDERGRWFSTPSGARAVARSRRARPPPRPPRGDGRERSDVHGDPVGDGGRERCLSAAVAHRRDRDRGQCNQLRPGSGG